MQKVASNNDSRVKHTKDSEAPKEEDGTGRTIPPARTSVRPHQMIAKHQEAAERRTRDEAERIQRLNSSALETNLQSDVPSFLEYVLSRQVVHFRRLEKPKDDEFFLELSRQHTYDDVVERVALQISLKDASKIRLTSHNCYSQQPKPQPIKYRGVERLSDMLVHSNQTSDILYFETLDLPLPELQGLKTLKVAFHNAKQKRYRYTIFDSPSRVRLGMLLMN